MSSKKTLSGQGADMPPAQHHAPHDEPAPHAEQGNAHDGGQENRQRQARARDQQAGKSHSGVKVAQQAPAKYRSRGR